MKRIAFFLDNSHIASVDCRGILEGNPGIGGTEYMFIVMAYLLSVRDNDLDVMSYVTSEGKFPEGYGYEVVTDFLDAVAHASAEGFDCLVFKHDAGLITSGVLDAVDTNLKLIVWDHVFVCYWELDYYANNPRIYKIVNVGREMNDLYRDHKAFGKSICIYNCLNLDGLREKVGCNPFEERKNIVVYVGALKPYKGFHLLAQAWPAIVKEVPDAELYVTQGFICRNLHDEVDNLRRGGSDYTASLVGAALGASEIQIWTDIDGMHDNDPRYVEGTRAVRGLPGASSSETASGRSSPVPTRRRKPTMLRTIL